MKRVIILLSCLVPLFANSQEKISLNFSHAKTWEELKREAIEANRPILIDAYATWCGPCKQMDDQVFTDKEVINFINEHFIPIRIQMDRTERDSEYTKNWLKESESIKHYITGYPCFLFFSPDGEFGGRELGYHEPDAFISLLKKAIDPEKSYYALLQKYQAGALTRDKLLTLAFLAEKNKDSIQTKLAREYKTRYLDSLPLDLQLRPSSRSFIETFYYKVFRPSDPIVRKMYDAPSKTDSLIQFSPGTSKNIVDQLIAQHYIEPFTRSNKGLTEIEPHWNNILRNITSDFDINIAKRLILAAKSDWELDHERFEAFVKLEFEKIDRYGLDTSAMGRVFFNNMVFQVVFKKIDDSKLLRRAASLMKYLIDLDTHASPSFLDTYACILYKSGNRKDALAMERLAIEVANKIKDENERNRRILYFNNVIKFMQQGRNIWEIDL